MHQSKFGRILSILCICWGLLFCPGPGLCKSIQLPLTLLAPGVYLEHSSPAKSSGRHGECRFTSTCIEALYFAMFDVQIGCRAQQKYMFCRPAPAHKFHLNSCKTRPHSSPHPPVPLRPSRGGMHKLCGARYEFVQTFKFT